MLFGDECNAHELFNNSRLSLQKASHIVGFFFFAHSPL